MTLLRFALCPLLAVTLHAQEARMSITAEDAEVELVNHSEGAISTQESKPNAENTKTLNSLEITQPTVFGEWQSLSLTFKVKADTNVILQLGGARLGKRNRVLFDKVEAKNATIINGDFETKAARAPKGWRGVNLSEYQEYNGEDESIAASGTRFARVTSKYFLSQNIAIPKDTEVTITAMIQTAAD